MAAVADNDEGKKDEATGGSAEEAEDASGGSAIESGEAPIADAQTPADNADTPSSQDDTPPAKRVVIVSSGGRVNIRVGNGTEYSRITAVEPSASFPYIATATNGWHAIVINGQVGWVSGDYSRIE